MRSRCLYPICVLGAVPTLDNLNTSVLLDSESGIGTVVFTVDYADANTLEADLLTLSIHNVIPAVGITLFSIHSTTGKLERKWAKPATSRIM